MRRFDREELHCFFTWGEHTFPLERSRHWPLAVSTGNNRFSIDAHLDLHDTDADYRTDSYGKYAHGTVMRRACDLGYSAFRWARAPTLGRKWTMRAKRHFSFEWKGDKAPRLPQLSTPITPIWCIDPRRRRHDRFYARNGNARPGGLDCITRLNFSAKFSRKKGRGRRYRRGCSAPGDVATEYGPRNCAIR